ncbi:Gfo/Idh/MocA family oxidoreductase [Candidatus Poribacteria bacterium]|nr:Gfo/Idh/MocA family oxidoreductase [Candidatus Poribacteria bacterium]
MGKTYRAAVIGCGGISHSHAVQYHRAEDIELVACADINEEALAKYRAEYGVERTYNDFEEMLDKEKPDLVSVCTWVGLHPTATIAAAKAGVRGILCEKPMAVNLALADEMLAACDGAGAKLAIGHQLRFHGPYVATKRLLADGEIGELIKVHGVCEGGDLIDNATHTVDLMRWFGDDSPTEWVMGQIHRGNASLKFGIAAVEDALGYWKSANGVRYFIESGRFTARGYHHIYLYGTEGEIEIGVPGGPALRFRSESTGGKWATTEMRDDSSPVRDLIDAVEGNREHRSSGRNGRAAHEVLLSIFESSRRRTLVPCPLETKGFPLQEMIDAGEV